MRAPALLLLLAAACSPASGTAVRLEVSYEDGWSLSSMEVAAGERSERAGAAHAVRLLMPDEWTGRPVTIAVTGLRGDERWAWGGVDVTPVRGEEVRGRVTLARLPCGAWCTAGSTACQGGATVVCEQRDADDCMEWSEPTACGGSTSCSLGTCLAACVDECASGEARCDGPGGLRRCGQADADPCRDWLPAETCPTGQACSNRACGGTCQHECDTGTTICLAAGTSTCGDLDHDGCREWGPVVACPTGQTCSDGACKTGCTAECTASECTGLLHRTCGQFDLDPCKELSPGTSCVPADPCREGSCTSAGGCASAPLACEMPPPDDCIDSDTLRVYSANGTCSDGACGYAFADQSCPGGCTGGKCQCTPGWATEVVDSTMYAGLDYSSLRVSNGVHIAYYSPTGRDLKYAYRPPGGGAWTRMTVDSVNDVGEYTALAADTLGGLHVSYRDSTSSDLKYAHRPAGGTWTATTVDAPGNVGGDTSLAVDSSGGVHISFYDFGFGMLSYAYRPVGGSWIVTDIDSMGFSDWGTSLAVGASGALHIAYYENSASDLKYAYRPPGGAWTTATVDSAGDVGMLPSLAADASGALHIAYYEYQGTSDGNLKYAFRPSGGSWTTTTVAQHVGFESSLVVDASGGVHVAYEDRTGNELKYAYRPPGGSWTATTVASKGDVGSAVSLAVEPSGQVHISYYDFANARFMYAVRECTP